MAKVRNDPELEKYRKVVTRQAERERLENEPNYKEYLARIEKGQWPSAASAMHDFFDEGLASYGLRKAMEIYLAACEHFH